MLEKSVIQAWMLGSSFVLAGGSPLDDNHALTAATVVRSIGFGAGDGVIVS